MKKKMKKEQTLISSSLYLQISSQMLYTVCTDICNDQTQILVEGQPECPIVSKMATTFVHNLN